MGEHHCERCIFLHTKGDHDTIAQTPLSSFWIYSYPTYWQENRTLLTAETELWVSLTAVPSTHWVSIWNSASDFIPITRQSTVPVFETSSKAKVCTDRPSVGPQQMIPTIDEKDTFLTERVWVECLFWLSLSQNNHPWLPLLKENPTSSASVKKIKVWKLSSYYFMVVHYIVHINIQHITFTYETSCFQPEHINWSLLTVLVHHLSKHCH